VCAQGEPGADGNQITVAVYVNDLPVTAYKEKDIQDSKTELERVYKTVAEHRGVKLPYLGMRWTTRYQEKKLRSRCKNTSMMC
jgi:hypothetical protein